MPASTTPLVLLALPARPERSTLSILQQLLTAATAAPPRILAQSLTTPTCKPPHNHNHPCTLLGTRAMHVHGKRATLLSCALSCMFNPERSHIKRWSRHTPQLHTCSSVSISAWVDMRRLGSSTSPPSHESRIWALREGRFLMRTGSGDLVQFGGGASSLESRVDGPL